MAKHIEYWYDETSDSEYPEYCVSLCEEDGEEIRCLSTHEDVESALRAAVAAANRRGCEVFYRESDGSIE